MFSWIFGRSINNNVNEEIIKKVVMELESKKIERELAIKEAYLEREKAYKLAEARESFFWTCPTGLIMSCISIVSSVKQKNIFHLLPLAPIFGVLTYHVHYAFGNKIEIITKNASQLLIEPENNFVTLSPITIEEVEKRKKEYREGKLDFF
uniref:Plasminogen receptor (KT) n=1 Tax=Parastrongyloides trichosuri TaxID=131310 RepID=A0A0N5A2U0_PARTI